MYKTENHDCTYRFKTFKEMLLEKTYNINKDVDILYKKAKFDKLVKAINSGNKDAAENFLKSTTRIGADYFFVQTDSSIFKSKALMKAHEISPIKSINCGLLVNGSFYDFRDSRLNISMNTNAFNMLRNNYYDFDVIQKQLRTQIKRFRSEFTEANIKGTIYHELVHWLDDVHNDRLLSVTKGSATAVKGKHNDINHSEIEVNSQIHKIKQLKRTAGAEYQTFALIDLLSRLPSLTNNFKNFRNEREYIKFMKSFIKRLDREKLLPKNMKNYPSYNEMKSILASI